MPGSTQTDKEAYARIIVDVHHQKVDRIFTYKVPTSLRGKLSLGRLVTVPFGKGNREISGYVIGLADEADAPDEKLKEISGVIGSRALFTKEELNVAQTMQERYMAPLSACLSLFVPHKVQQHSDPVMVKMVELVSLPAKPLKGKAQNAFLAALLSSSGEEHSERKTLKSLRAAAPISAESLRSLEKAGYIRVLEVPEEEVPAEETPALQEADFELNEDQNYALGQVEDAMEADGENGTFREFLLYGITGSGKTEVYMRAIQKALSLGKEAVMLVPEISLTPQLIDLFSRRFGNLVGVTHSRMTDKERTQLWHRADEGKCRVVIGPRSALFTPFHHLGLIVMDEEHETSYRSDQQVPHYHAREVAEMMAKEHHCPLLLGSATPSIETYYRARQGDIQLLRLPKRAAAHASLPSVTLVDMRQELASGNMSIFCGRLVRQIQERLRRKEQTILFLNRKGYATFVSCRKCGFVLKCPNCYLPYTYHKDTDRLICHHCGKEVRLPAVCPNCGSTYLKQFGVGTQRVEEETKRMFPDAQVVRMDMSTMKKREDYKAVYEAFRGGKGDILIGTQMVAKGFDFPKVTLVGVLAADIGLYGADYHSPERTFQLLTQVAGRAGRSDKKGEVVIQTYSPEHYCIQCAKDQDYDRFYEQEITARKMLDCPPFTHLAQVAVSGRQEEAVQEGIKRLGHMMRSYALGRPIEVLGPSPAQLVRINNVFRYKLIIKCAEQQRLASFVYYCCKKWEKEEPSLTYMADIDPPELL